MSTLDTYNHVNEPRIPALTSSPHRYRSAIVYSGVGCLFLIALFTVGAALLIGSGVLRGPGGENDEMPSCSPDGKQIVFHSNRDGYSDIFVMNDDGSHVTQLTRDPYAYLYLFKSATDWAPDWSPDGKSISFVSGRDNAMMSYIDFNIYMMNADGSNVVRLSQETSVEVCPEWSPDGQRIAFNADDTLQTYNPSEGIRSHIFVMRADGTNTRQLTYGPANDVTPDWSPDGKHIVFSSDRAGSWGIYIITEDGSDMIRLTDDGSDMIRLTDDSSDEGDPTWSPDGRSIAFSSAMTGSFHIYVMEVDGRKTQLTRGAANDVQPAWSPDGRRIAFTSDRRGNRDIFVMNADGSNLLQLTGK